RVRYSLRQKSGSSIGRSKAGEVVMSERGSTENVPTRRDFLSHAAGAVAATTATAAAGGEVPATTSLLPTVKLGSHAVTRLILGGNPIYGYSHFNKILSQYQSAWHTPERVVDLLQHAETQ